MPKLIQVEMDNSRKKIGGKWKPTILFLLYAKSERFNKLKQLMDGISPNELSKNLKEMEDNGLVYKDGEPIKYHLSENAIKITALLYKIQEITDTLPMFIECYLP